MTTQGTNQYIEWIRATLAKKPHLSQAGLAKHLDRNRSVVTSMLNGSREIKARELALIEAYLGERMPVTGTTQTAPEFVSIAGIVGDAWYEAGKAPARSGRIAPVADAANVRQVGYVIDMAAPAIGALPGAVLVATPVDRSHQPKAGQIVVCRRERAGLENLTIGRVGADGKSVALSGGDAGQPVAIAIEVRNRL